MCEFPSQHLASEGKFAIMCESELEKTLQAHILTERSSAGEPRKNSLLEGRSFSPSSNTSLQKLRVGSAEPSAERRRPDGVFQFEAKHTRPRQGRHGGACLALRPEGETLALEERLFV